MNTRGYQADYRNQLGRCFRFRGRIELLSVNTLLLVDVHRVSRKGAKGIQFDHVWMDRAPFNAALKEVRIGGQVLFTARLFEYRSTLLENLRGGGIVTYAVLKIGLRDPEDIRPAS